MQLQPEKEAKIIQDLQIGYNQDRASQNNATSSVMILMKRLKIQSPPDIHDQKVVIISRLYPLAMRRTKSALKENSLNVLNTSSHSRGSLKRSLSPGIRLYNFSGLKSYRNITGPFLPVGKKEAIMSKLQLDKLTANRTTRRMKSGHSFVSFKYNPFHPQMELQKEDSELGNSRLRQTSRSQLRQSLSQTSMKGRKKKPVNGKDGKENKQKKENKNETLKKKANLVHQVNNLKSMKNFKENQLDQTMKFQRTKEQRELITKISSLVLLNSEKALLHPPPLQEQAQVEQKKNKILSFEDVVELQQVSFFKDRLKNINLFSAIFKDKEELFNKNQCLYDNFFCFNSLIEKINRVKVFFMRDLSKEARLNANHNPKSKSNDKNHHFEAFDFADLRFEDLMNVAAGRTTPQFVFAQMNQERLDNKSDNLSEVEDEEEIILRKDNVSKGSNVMNDHEGLKEVREFMKIGYTKDEKYCKDRCVMRKQEILAKLKLETSVLKNKILDKKLVNSIQQDVNHDMHDFLEYEYRRPRNPMEMGIFISRSKNEKTRKQAIKLEELLDTCHLVKEDKATKQHLKNKPLRH